MDIKIKSEMSPDEIEFFSLMNRHKYEEALKLYYGKINKPFDYLIAEIEDNNDSTIKSPLFYINGVKLNVELYQRFFSILDIKFFNIQMDLFSIKKTNPSFFENHKIAFRVCDPYDSYTSIFNDYKFYLNNPEFLMNTTLSTMKKNINDIFNFLESKNIAFDDEGFNRFVHDFMINNWSSEKLEDYCSMIMKHIKSKDEKIWYSFYMKIHSIETCKNGEYTELCKIFKQKVMEDKIKNFNFDKLPKYNKESFASILISRKEYIQLYEYLKNDKLSTVHLGDELLNLALDFTKETLKKERDKILACIQIIFEKGCNLEGLFKYGYSNKKDFSSCFEEITSTRWDSKKLIIRRKEEMISLFNLHVPHQEAKIIKKHLNIKEYTSENAPRKRL